MENGKQCKQSRNWAFIVYAEDIADINCYAALLRSRRIKALISPLHRPAKPAKEADQMKVPFEEDLKPHYHVLVNWPYPMTYETAFNHFKRYLKAGGGKAFMVHDTCQYTRYLIHMDDPDKEQLDPFDMISIGGYKVNFSSSDDSVLKDEALVWAEDFIMSSHCSYAELYRSSPLLYRKFIRGFATHISVLINSVKEEFYYEN